MYSFDHTARADATLRISQLTCHSIMLLLYLCGSRILVHEARVSGQRRIQFINIHAKLPVISQLLHGYCGFYFCYILGNLERMRLSVKYPFIQVHRLTVAKRQV